MKGLDHLSRGASLLRDALISWLAFNQGRNGWSASTRINLLSQGRCLSIVALSVLQVAVTVIVLT
jgi:hypothetical protein